MTWQQLAKQISEMSFERQNDDVTVLDTASDEIFAVSQNMVSVAGEDEDRLDIGHYFLQIP